MKKYFITFNWMLDGIPQHNVLPAWASSEVSALNIARTRLLAMAKSTGERWSIINEEVSTIHPDAR